MNLEDRLKKLKDSTSDSKKLRKFGKYSTINPEIVILLLKEGARMPEIAKIYGCSDQTIKYQMRIFDPDFDGRSYHKWRKRNITVEIAVKLYEEIKNATKIARLLNVNTHAITDRLKVAGIKLKQSYREDISTEKIVELYQKYKTTSKVAEILDTNTPMVIRRLKNAGIELDFSYRNKVRRTDIPIKQVLKLYDNGKSLQGISREYSSSLGTIRKIILDNGGEIRKEPSLQRPDLTQKKVINWYSKMKSVVDVAKKLKTNPETIRKRLKQAGVCIKNIRKRKRADIPIKKVKTLIENGHSTSSIAKKYHTKRETIKKILDGYWDKQFI